MRALSRKVARPTRVVGAEKSQNERWQKPMDGSYIVYGSPGSGSVPVEAALALIGAPYKMIGESVLRDVAHNPAVLKVNPLGQVPALVLPGGEVMTESGYFDLAGRSLSRCSL